MIVSVFSDASYDEVRHLAGWGAWVKSNRGKQVGGGAMRSRPTNIIEAEGYALVNAIDLALRNGVACKGDKLIVATDNMPVIRLVTGERTAEKPWQIKIMEYLNYFRDRFELSFDFRHVKGHSPELGRRNQVNDLCDSLAKEGLTEARAAFRRKSRKQAQDPVQETDGTAFAP